MKKIVYAVYHDINKEERSRELLNCCRKLGKVDLITYEVPKGVKDISVHIINKTSVIALFLFIYTIKKVISTVKPDYVVLHDNDCSVIIPFLKKKYPAVKIIYDSSELYIKKNPGQTKKVGWKSDGFMIWIKQKITSFRSKYEKKYLKYADVVIAANLERAKIMKDYFQLDKIPIIFDNIHKIEDEYDEAACEVKFSNIIEKNGFNILFGGGISEERKTFDYIQAIDKLDARFNLIIAGSASIKAKKKYDVLLSKCKRDRIHYVGFVSRAELRYLMQKCQASVVLFDKDSYNTLYCASGKCYESLFEDTPILASENPPLKRLCDIEKIGVSNDNYEQGIIQLSSNYDYYVKNVKRYVYNLQYEYRVANLVKEIKNILGEKSE